MFQDTADMPGMGNDLDRSKKKTGEAGNYQQELQKQIIFDTFAFGLFYSMLSKFFALPFDLIYNGPCAPKQKR